MTDNFWGVIKAQVEELRTAKGADDVLRILSKERDPYGPDHETGGCDAFFAGGGGDDTVHESLVDAGWRTIWYEAWYYWAMRAPDGTVITYIEGDIFARDTKAVNA
jgi:hypothetical protein